jgi:ppGpp synthetase/RelA/SpoT-type nucleotidyltranferase
VVSDSLAQNQAVELITKAFENVDIQDRRMKPSHGYRAVHVIIRDDGKPIEVQIRTALQQVWAELSEKFADLIDASIKYGGGPPSVREALDRGSTMVGIVEKLELAVRNADIAEQLREAREEYVRNLQALSDADVEVDT